MTGPDFLLFLGLVVLGSLVQSITGFAMALIVMGGVALLGVADIRLAAAVVSLITVVNSTLALRRNTHHVDVSIWRALLIGLLPCTLLGVLLLDYLSNDFYELLRLALGVVIILAGTLLMFQPRPFDQPSGALAAMLFGGAGGLIGGLYGAGGAPMAWFIYRQPMSVLVARATLLATFLVSTLGRTLVVAVAGHITREVLVLAAMSIPLVVAATLVGNRLGPLLPDRLIRRIVFAVLILLGAMLIAQSLWQTLGVSAHHTTG